MRIFLPALLSASLFVSHSPAQTAALAQAEESKPQVVEGQVRSYEAGKSLEVELRPMVAQTFNLSASSTRYVISPEVKVGSKVEVTESRSETGQKTIYIRVKP